MFLKEIRRETRNDEAFYARLIILVWLTSATGLAITLVTFVLIAFFKDNAMCE